MKYTTIVNGYCIEIKICEQRYMTLNIRLKSGHDFCLKYFSTHSMFIEMRSPT